jgi:hypothetical protein
MTTLKEKAPKFAAGRFSVRLKRDVDERFAGEPDAIEHVVKDEGGQKPSDERSKVSDERSRGSGERRPEFAEGGVHGGEGKPRV